MKPAKGSRGWLYRADSFAARRLLKTNAFSSSVNDFHLAASNFFVFVILTLKRVAFPLTSRRQLPILLTRNIL
jgi:hypothetical protein